MYDKKKEDSNQMAEIIYLEKGNMIKGYLLLLFFFLIWGEKGKNLPVVNLREEDEKKIVLKPEDFGSGHG